MANWKRFLLIGAGFGAGVATISALILGGWMWYRSRPAKPKPWDTRAIVATFDYPATETGQFTDDPKAESIVVYYTLENETDTDYRMPPQEQIEVDFYELPLVYACISKNAACASPSNSPVSLPIIIARLPFAILTGFMRRGKPLGGGTLGFRS